MKLQRPLCDLERAFWLLDCGTSMNGLGVVSIRGPLNEGLVRAGLAQLQARHPVLRMRIVVVGDDRKLQFTEAGAGPIPLRVVHRQAASDWQGLVEQELNQRFALQSDHLSRVTLLVDAEAGQNTLILTHHHVIADALSIVYVVRDLLTCICAIISSAGPDAATLPSLPLLPPLPELLPPRARGLARLSQMSAYFHKHIIKGPLRNARKLPIEQPAPPHERHNRVEQRTLAGAVLQALFERARAEGTSVQGVLSAALLLATAKEAYAAELAAATPTTVGCFTPVNLREQLEPRVVDDMGLFISQVTTFHQIIPLPSLWQLAKEVKAQLAETLASGEQFLTLPLIGLFIPWGKNPGPRFIRRFDGGSPAALGLSNLARPPIPSAYGPLHIDNFHLAVGVSIVGQLLAIVTTWEDRLTLNLVFAEPLVSRARAQRIADGAIAHLQDAAASSATPQS